jgi:pyroglutamyl-peptidase
MRTLLTGFGPFGGVVNNPSSRIVAYFARAGAPGHDLTTRVLPVSYARAEREIRALLRAGRFDSALLLGVAGRETHLRLEQIGRWAPAHRLDGDGLPPPNMERPPGALEFYSTPVALGLLMNHLLASGLPARVSDDAGSYVCNHTYYAALQTIAAEELPTRCLFLHVPADSVTFSEPPAAPTLALPLQIKAVERILAWLARSDSDSGVWTDDG